jgi:hypothetical protein
MGLQGGLFKGLSGSLARGTIRGVTLRSSRFTLKIHRPGQTETQSIQVLSVNSKTPKRPAGRAHKRRARRVWLARQPLPSICPHHLNISCSGARRGARQVNRYRWPASKLVNNINKPTFRTPLVEVAYFTVCLAN